MNRLWRSLAAQDVGGPPSGPETKVRPAALFTMILAAGWQGRNEV